MYIDVITLMFSLLFRCFKVVLCLFAGGFEWSRFVFILTFMLAVCFWFEVILFRFCCLFKWFLFLFSFLLVCVWVSLGCYLWLGLLVGFILLFYCFEGLITYAWADTDRFAGDCFSFLVCFGLVRSVYSSWIWVLWALWSSWFGGLCW